QRRAGRGHQPDEGDVRADRHHVPRRHEERREQREGNEQQDIEAEEQHHARLGPAEEGEERTTSGAGGGAIGHRAGPFISAAKAGSLAVAAMRASGEAPFSKRPTTRPRSRTTLRSPMPATSSTSEESTRTARPRSASARSWR